MTLFCAHIVVMSAKDAHQDLYWYSRLLCVLGTECFVLGSQVNRGG